MCVSLSLPHSTTNAFKEWNRYERFVPNCGCQGILLELLYDATPLHFAPKPRQSSSCSHRFQWCRHTRNEEECREPAIEARQADRMEKKESSTLGEAPFLSLQTPFKYSPAVPKPKVRKSVGGRSRRAACLPACLSKNSRVLFRLLSVTVAG